MHYFDGTEAKLGDTIAKEPAAGPEHYDGMLKAHETAVVVRLHPNSDAYNVEAVVAAVVARPRGEVAAALDALTGCTKAFKLLARAGA